MIILVMVVHVQVVEFFLPLLLFYSLGKVHFSHFISTKLFFLSLTVYILVIVRAKRSFSKSECASYYVQDGAPDGEVSGSPPYKRMTKEARSPTVSDSTSVVPADPTSTLESLIREAHSQYHDRLKELRRDCQLMARHFLKQRDDKISFYTRNLSSDTDSIVTSLGCESASDSPDFDLDLVGHARVTSLNV